MLHTYILLPVTRNSSPSAISCYTHTYCCQLQEIPNRLPYHVTHIRTVASCNKFLTLCHIMLHTYVLLPVTTNSSPSAISCYTHSTVASYKKFLKVCHIMLLTYVLLPVTTNSSPSAISCYTHTYCRQLQQIPHSLPYHVTNIRTVANYIKFLTLCHIMLLSYVLLPDTTNSSHSAISCYSHTYCCQIQQIPHTLPYDVTLIRTVDSYNKFLKLSHIMLHTYVLSAFTQISSRSAI